MTYIRWQGIILFIALISSIGAAVTLFAPGIAKSNIKNALELQTGAEVNINSVELNWQPFSIQVNKLQATDNRQASHNLFSFDTAVASLDLWQYILGHTIVEELSVSNLQLSQKRNEPGQVYRKSSEDNQSLEDKAKQLLPLDDLKLPDPKTLLNNSKLKTVNASKQLASTYKTEKQNLELAIQGLPDKAKLKAYQQRLQEISKYKIKTADDVSRLTKELKNLKHAFEQDKQKLEQAKKVLASSKQALGKALKDLKDAPEQDWQDIKTKYQLEQLDAADFAHMLFGEQAREYYQQASEFYNLISPHIQSTGNEQETASSAEETPNATKGRYVHFDQDKALPTWLIKKTHIELINDKGIFDISANELTQEHWLRNKPSSIKLSANKKDTAEQITLSSEFFINKARQLRSEGQWKIEALKIDEQTLIQQDSLQLGFDTAALFSQGKFTLNNGEINSRSQVNLQEIAYKTVAQSKLAKALVETLKSLPSIDLAINLAGDLSSPNLSIQSELDRIIKKTIETKLKGKLLHFQTKLQNKLNAKLATALKVNQDDKNDIINIETLLSSTDKGLNQLLESDLVKQGKQQLQQKLEDKLKDKAEDKLKEKLGDKLNKFFG